MEICILSNKKLIGFTLATTAAVLFSTVPVSSAFADTAPIPCYGANACKGQSQCKSINNACNGENSCKGKGLSMLSPQDCETAGGDDEPATIEP
jgi:hypothetical protein